MDDDCRNDESALRDYEAPELIVLATVHEATLGDTEGGADGLQLFSNTN